MSQTIIAGTRLGSGSTGNIINVGLWILQIGASGMFLMVGFFKLSGDPRMVELFDAVGVGQWFRYLTGSVEVLGAVLLLIPRLSGLGALLLVGASHKSSFKQVPKKVFATLFPGAAEAAEMFSYFQAHTYLGSDSYDRIALANKIAGGQPSKLSTWAGVNLPVQTP